MKNYYLAYSAHGSESSHGFANDTIVEVYNSKIARDNAVRNSSNISCVAIKRNDVTRMATNWNMSQNCEIKPEPFTGQFWAICNTDDNNESGYVGYISICNDEYDYGFVQRFYN